MKLSKKDIRELLNKEIEWTFKHQADNLSKDFQNGFRAGLKQAIYIIEEAIEELEKMKKITSKDKETWWVSICPDCGMNIYGWKANESHLDRCPRKRKEKNGKNK